MRYSCQTAAQATRPDEPGSFSEPGCVSCGSTTQLEWVDIPAPGERHALRRIKSKTSVTGVRTSYEHDAQGRVIAECENDSDNIVSRANPSSCPSTGQWQGWWYEDTGVAPWAVHEHQQRSVRGSSYAPYSKIWTHSAATGLLTQVTETGWTYSESTWNWAQQTRTTTYSYASSPHDGWTAVTGPSTRSETINYHALAAGDANSGQVLHRWRSRNHPTLGALTPLRTLTTTYSLYGAPGYESDESGVITTRTFDSAGRVRTSTTPLGTTRTAYDDKGRLLSIRAPSGQATVFEYDGASERPSRLMHPLTPPWRKPGSA